MSHSKEPLNELALFAGAGGGLLASRLLGWNTIGACEIEEYPRSSLLNRQQDGYLDHFPIWDDVRTFNGYPWRGLVDVISGGFPCQDISPAGKRKGLAGKRSGLWVEYRRIIEEVRPRFVFSENSSDLRTRGLGTIVNELTGLGYIIRWGVLGAWHIGANHRRNRMWLLAYTDEAGQRSNSQRRSSGEKTQGGDNFSWRSENGIRNTSMPRLQNGVLKPSGSKSRSKKSNRRSAIVGKKWWKTEPKLGRVANGVADRVDRIKAIGEGQVPLVAATAWRLLTHDLEV